MNTLKRFLTLGVGVPLTTQLQQIEQDGNLVPGGALVAALRSMLQSGAWSGQAFWKTASGTSATITNMQNAVYQYTAGQAVTITFDYAYNIVNQVPNPFLGQSFWFEIVTNAATTIATPTLSDTAVTLAGGATTVTAAGLRKYLVTITQLSTTTGAPVTSGTTFTSIAQVGSTNAYTVTLGTNALSPVVGQAIYLNVTAGTLPAGWYPVVKVTSATSFVICAPISGSAWTATAATVPGTTTVPSSQYTPGFPGVYSPLITVTGAYGTVLNTMAV